MGVREYFVTLKEFVGLMRNRRYLAPRPAETTRLGRPEARRNRRPKFGDRTMLLFEGRQITWKEFNELANQLRSRFEGARHRSRRHRQPDDGKPDRISRRARGRGQTRRGRVADQHEPARSTADALRLRHAIESVDLRRGTVRCVAGVKADLNLQEGSGYLFVTDAGKNRVPNWAVDLGRGSARRARRRTCRTRKRIKLGDNATFLFTSGTTGLPKAAVVSHRRFLGDRSHDLAARPEERRERSAVHLPAAVSRHRTDGRILFGVVVRLVDVRPPQILGVELSQRDARIRHDVFRLHRRTLSLPGEPARAAERRGQSPRANRWQWAAPRHLARLQEAGTASKRITEFYGASEGNVAFMNLLNKDRTIGMTASTIALVRYDVDADEIIRDAPDVVSRSPKANRDCCLPKSTKRRCSRATPTPKPRGRRSFTAC